MDGCWLRQWADTLRLWLELDAFLESLDYWVVPPFTWPIFSGFVRIIFLLGKWRCSKHSLDSRAMLHLRYDLLGFPPAVRYVGFWTQKWEKDSSYVGTYITRPPKEVTVFLDTNRIARNVWNIIFFGMPYEFSTILNMHMRSVSDQIHLHILNFKTPWKPCFQGNMKTHEKKSQPKIPAFPRVSLPDLDHNGRLEAAERKLADHLSFFRLAKYRPLGPKGWVSSEDSGGRWHTHCVFYRLFWRFWRLFFFESTMITSKMERVG